MNLEACAVTISHLASAPAPDRLDTALSVIRAYHSEILQLKRQLGLPVPVNQASEQPIVHTLGAQGQVQQLEYSTVPLHESAVLSLPMLEVGASVSAAAAPKPGDTIRLNTPGAELVVRVIAAHTRQVVEGNGPEANTDAAVPAPTVVAAEARGHDQPAPLPGVVFQTDSTNSTESQSTAASTGKTLPDTIGRPLNLFPNCRWPALAQIPH